MAEKRRSHTTEEVSLAVKEPPDSAAEEPARYVMLILAQFVTTAQIQFCRLTINPPFMQR